MARLVIIGGERRGTELSLGPRQRIGRLPDNDIVIDDASVSRHHAEIRRDGAVWWVQDLGSSHGTSVNGEPITKSPLADGDRLTVGKTELAFIDEAGAAPDPAGGRTGEMAASRRQAPGTAPLGPGAVEIVRTGEISVGDMERAKKTSGKRLAYSPNVGRKAGALGGDLGQIGGGGKTLLYAAVLLSAVGLFWLIQHLVARG